MAVDMTPPTRKLELEAVFNFRDLGGYAAADGRALAWGRLYRADGLQRMTAGDVERVRRLGLRTVVDLRTQGELDERGRFPLDELPATYHHLPMIDVTPDHSGVPVPPPEGWVAEQYLGMIEEGRSHIVEALGVLSAPGALPAVFHCAAGKDRTGILAAIVLGLCGVPDEVIVEDYAMSAEAMAHMIEWFRVNVPDVAEQFRKRPSPMIGAEPETMRQLLAHIAERHGSMEAFVADLGVAPEVVARLRDALLVDASAVDAGA